MIVEAVKLCQITSDGNRLASEPVGLETGLVLLSSLLSPFDGDVTICLDDQLDFFSDSFGGGHRDDAFGEEGAGGEERAEEDKEPDAELLTHSLARD